MPNHRTRERAVLAETSAPRVPPLGVVAYTPNPVGLVQLGVGHARKPGDPFRTWTMRPQSRQ